MPINTDASVNYISDFTDIVILKLIKGNKLAKDIAKTLSFSKPAVSKRLRRLAASGLIVIQKVGLIKELTLTPEGNSKLMQLTDANGPISVNYLATHRIRIEAL
ncbi:MAG: hypothetical protein OH344_03900, partial [Candidatus Parvarchaeota archaeon]|nr:hypothetical protein [Candidatus Jingweiarchaeum tengchongense]